MGGGDEGRGGGGGEGGASDAPNLRQGFPWQRNHGRLHTQAHISSQSSQYNCETSHKFSSNFCLPTHWPPCPPALPPPPSTAVGSILPTWDDPLLRRLYRGQPIQRPMKMMV